MYRGFIGEERDVYRTAQLTRTSKNLASIYRANRKFLALTPKIGYPFDGCHDSPIRPFSEERI